MCSDLFVGTPTERFISAPRVPGATSIPLGSMFSGVDAQTFPPPIFSATDQFDGMKMTQKLDTVDDAYLYKPYKDTVRKLNFTVN